MTAFDIICFNIMVAIDDYREGYKDSSKKFQSKREGPFSWGFPKSERKQSSNELFRDKLFYSLVVMIVYFTTAE